MIWVGGGSRYAFYPKERWCQNRGFFRFGKACRKCSTGPCPDGQFRVPCTGGSDSYCSRCTNTCLLFADGVVFAAGTEVTKRVRAWVIKYDTANLNAEQVANGVGQVEWKANGRTFFVLRWIKEQNLILVNYCNEKGFSVSDCSLLQAAQGNTFWNGTSYSTWLQVATSQASVAYNFFDPRRTSSEVSWTVIMDENGHHLISDQGELLYQRYYSDTTTSIGRDSMAVDAKYYADRQIFIEEMAAGTCALTSAAINGAAVVNGAGFAKKTGCDPNSPFDSKTELRACAYTSEGTPGAAFSDCQIESCCRDCTNEEEAKSKGFSVVCPSSAEGFDNPDEAATVRFDAEVPLSKADFEAQLQNQGTGVSVQKQYMDIIAGLSSTVDSVPQNPANKVKVVWAQERQRDSTFRSELDLSSPESADNHVSTLVGFEVSTIASQVDATWSTLSEDAVNEAAARKNLAPIVVFSAENPTDTPSTNNAVTIALSITGSVLALCCCGGILYCKSRSGGQVPRSNNDAWSQINWADIPPVFQDAWTALGYNASMWDEGLGKAPVDNLSWSELSKEQQAAATVLGYTEYMWDNDQSPAVIPSIPGVASDNVAADLSSEWEEKFDATEGKPYWVNHVTKSTQWERPVGSSRQDARTVS